MLHELWIEEGWLERLLTCLMSSDLFSVLLYKFLYFIYSSWTVLSRAHVFEILGHFFVSNSWPLSKYLYTIAKIRSSIISIADQKLSAQVHEIVGRINGRFGTLTTVPIHHLVSHVP